MNGGFLHGRESPSQADFRVVHIHTQSSCAHVLTRVRVCAIETTQDTEHSFHFGHTRPQFLAAAELAVLHQSAVSVTRSHSGNPRRIAFWNQRPQVRPLWSSRSSGICLWQEGIWGGQVGWREAGSEGMWGGNRAVPKRLNNPDSHVEDENALCDLASGPPWSEHAGKLAPLSQSARLGVLLP